jgi:trk system potassium uptake protein TrkA
MKVIIMGCGKVGEQLCRLLDHAGHDVTVVDSETAALSRLGSEFRGRKIQGVGFDRDVLIQAGIERAEGFAATSASDNANIIAARIARNIFHVPRVVARLYDPRRAEIYRRLGLTTLSMTAWGAERIHELLTHTEIDPVFSFGKGEVSLVSTEISPQMDGRLVKDLTVPGEIHVSVLVRENEAIIPTLGTTLKGGDIAYLVVHASSLDRLEALMGFE